MPICFSLYLLIEISFNSISPEEYSSRLFNIRNNVDFPAPDLPNKIAISPEFTMRERLFIISV